MSGQSRFQRRRQFRKQMQILLANAMRVPDNNNNNGVNGVNLVAEPPINAPPLQVDDQDSDSSSVLSSEEGSVLSSGNASSESDINGYSIRSYFLHSLDILRILKYMKTNIFLTIPYKNGKY